MSRDPPIELTVLATDDRLGMRGFRDHSWFVYGLSPRGESGAAVKESKASIVFFFGGMAAIAHNWKRAQHRGAASG